MVKTAFQGDEEFARGVAQIVGQRIADVEPGIIHAAHFYFKDQPRINTQREHEVEADEERIGSD